MESSSEVPDESERRLDLSSTEAVRNLQRNSREIRLVSLQAANSAEELRVKLR